MFYFGFGNLSIHLQFICVIHFLLFGCFLLLVYKLTSHTVWTVEILMILLAKFGLVILRNVSLSLEFPGTMGKRALINNMELNQ